ncbi:MBL fold metallo-hydrolase [Acuticoccus sp. M5D2P5]|uniref:MBL fold metallo-hydrolase n=1 Tax=Acuticoccus kalidii TaxID=2910977 RepID=UPI001F4084A6|nr:MBL fold metallo-hydrolase [Acuticoccus kalidii]MCF3931822.1 MBL fold metallo-hydrolase [Acuticoccus kalidii]
MRVTAPNTGPFTGAGTNTYLLGERELMVVDPGPDDAAHRDALIAAIAGRPVTHILVTHTHRDHVDGLAKLVRAVGGETVGEGPYRDSRVLRPGETNPFAKASDTGFHPDTLLGDGGRVANADVTVTAIATPGHTANHLAFTVGDDLLSGDHVMGWSTTVIAPPDGSMADYITSLDRLIARPHARYLPGHGDVIAEPQRAVAAMKSHRLMRERAIVDRLQKGDRTIVAIVEALYVGLDARLKGAAGLSVLAHLEKLEGDRKVASEGFGTEASWSLV